MEGFLFFVFGINDGTGCDSIFLMAFHLILLLAASSFAADNSCARWEKEFSKDYSLIKTQCREHSDCVVGNYDWDPCVAQAVSKEQTFQDYVGARNALHKVCGYIRKPCAAVIEPVYCLGGKCAMHSDVERRFPAYRFIVPKLKEGKVTLMRDTGIRCGVEPCPSSEEVFRGRIKNHRFSIPNHFFLGEEGKKDSWFVIDSTTIRTDANNWTKNISSVIRLNY
jgi:hypothetical protein